MQRALLPILALLLAACGRSELATAPAPATTAPAAASDLVGDPTVRRGTLANGLRYALMRSQQPPGKLSLRLRIGSGSIEETDEQRGLAHYLEHMAFNGSEHFPPGELVPRLEKAGLAFGAHTNAHTSYDETVYKLDLPDLAPATIELGLNVIADQASRLLLKPSEIERERGVILAEMRDRESPSFRISVRQNQSLYAGARAAERMPIGLAETVKAADATRLRDYYATWYRPERMVLAVVGDIDPAALEPQVRAAFSGVSAGAPARPEPGSGHLTPGEAAIAIHEAEADGTGVTISRVVERERPVDNRASRQVQFLRDLGEHVISRRLQERIQADTNGPLLSGSPFSYQWLGFYQAGISGAAKPGRALDALGVLAEEWRRMAAYGPTDAELAIVRAATLAELDRGVAQAAARANPGLANAIVEAAGDDQAFLSPEQTRELYRGFLEGLTPAAVREAFAAGWMSGPGRTVAIIAGQEDLGITGDQRVGEAFRAAWAKPVSSPTAKARAAWAYSYSPTWQGDVPEPAADALCVSGIFNGIAIQAKRTDFQPNQVLMRLRLAGRTDPRQPAVDGLVGSAFLQGGLGKHSISELSEILAGTSIRPSGPGIGDDGVTFDVSCLPGELARACETARAFLTDPGWRVDAESRCKTAWLQQFDSESTDLDTTLGRRIGELFHPDQPWRRMATAEDVRTVSFATAKTWFEPILQKSPLIVSIVGDIDPRIAIRTAAGYLGGSGRPLPTAYADAASARAALPAETPAPVGEHRYEVPGTAPRAVIMAFFPTADIYDIARTRRLNLLAAAFTERLRERIRQELGQAYSPSASQSAGTAWRDQGSLVVHVSVAPDQVDPALAALRGLASDLHEHGISEDLLSRVKEPQVRNLAGYRRQNGYWLGQVLDRAADQPFRLEWSRSMESDIAAITASDLSQLATTYLDNAKALVVIGICRGAKQP